MISLKAVSERIAIMAQTVDAVLSMAPLENFLATHEKADEEGYMRPQMFRSSWGDEKVEVAIATMRRRGGLVCNKFTVEVETDVVLEAREGQIYATLKRTGFDKGNRQSRMHIKAEFERDELDPEGVERQREQLVEQSFGKQSQPKEDDNDGSSARGARAEA